MEDLTLAQRNQLLRIRQKMGESESTLVSVNDTMRSIVAWAQQNYIDTDNMHVGKRVRFTKQWFQQVERALVACHFQALVKSVDGDRVDSAHQGDTEHKGRSDSPRRQRVLLATRDGVGLGIQYTRDVPQWLVVDEDYRNIQLEAFDHLIMVENLTVFYRLHELAITWPPRALIVYRGDRFYHSGFKRLLHVWKATGRTKYGLVDLDAFSIKMLQRYDFEYVAVPTLERFKALSAEAHLPAKQLNLLLSLQAKAELGAYVEWMKQTHRGLKQEWMHFEPMRWVNMQDQD